MIQDLKLEECLELLGKNYIGRLAFVGGKSPYVLPITYFHDAEDRCILSYSAQGHKLDSMRIYKWVSFQVDRIESIQNWKSVLVHGNFEELTGSTAKKYLHKFAEGVQETILKNEGVSPKFIQDFSSRLSQRGIPIVYKINITDISGKFRNE